MAGTTYDAYYDLLDKLEKAPGKDYDKRFLLGAIKMLKYSADMSDIMTPMELLESEIKKIGALVDSGRLGTL